MLRKQFKLKYANLGKLDNIYTDIDLSSEQIVNAQYRKVFGYEGNPDICALPRPLTGKEIGAYNMSKPPVIVKGLNAKDLTVAERRICINAIHEVVFPMPYHCEIENAINEVLISSYSSRQIFATDFKSKIDEDTVYSKRDSLGKSTDSFALIGSPGIGKSTALGLTLSRYPKAIRHQFDDGTGYTQIPILYATAYPNSNISSIFIDYSQQIDFYLDNGGFYEQKMQANKSLGGKANYLAKLIEIFHIGLLIIDDAQFIKCSSEQESTFEQFVTITAKTGISIAVSGNTDIFKRWSNLRIERRMIRKLIRPESDNSKLIQQIFSTIINNLWNLNFTDSKCELSADISKTLFEESCGSIDMLMLLYTKMQLLSISSGKYKGCTFTSDIIKEISHKYFSSLKEKFVSGKYSEYKDEQASLLKAFSEESTRLKNQMAISDIYAINEKLSYDHDAELLKITESIRTYFPKYTEKNISNAFCQAESLITGFKTMTEQDRARQVLGLLQKKESTKSTVKELSAKKLSNQDELVAKRDNLIDAINSTSNVEHERS